MVNSLIGNEHAVDQSRSSSAAKKKPVVLCIDDDPDICRSLQVQLEHVGLEVQTALFGTHGYWDALVRRPDVIITDLRMPQGSGDYIIECLKQNPKTRNIPIIVLTGRDDPYLKRYLTGLGIARFFSKPLAFKELCKELALYIPISPRGEKKKAKDSSSSPQAIQTADA